tara:strand:- start:563 stop:958 length:396 start_codon:yes stop_codon:yes gene_type:complete
MTARRKVLPILAGALMIGLSTAALGQAAKMTAGLEKFTAASRDLVKLYTGSKDEASGKAMAGKISAAAKRKDAAEKAIQAAMQKLNPKSQKDGKLAEKVFAEMQARNQAVAEAQIKAAANIAKSKAMKMKN